MDSTFPLIEIFAVIWCAFWLLFGIIKRMTLGYYCRICRWGEDTNGYVVAMLIYSFVLIVFTIHYFVSR